MEIVEKQYQISFYGETNLKNTKFIILNETGINLLDFRFKIINKILKCTISSNPIIVCNEKNEYFIVCDTKDIRDIFKEWICIDSNIMMKIISIKPSLFTFSEYKNTMLNFTNPNNDTFKSVLQTTENTSNTDITNISSMTTMPSIPNFGSISRFPKFGSIPSVPNFGSIPNFPTFGTIPNTSNSVNDVSFPTFGTIPNTSNSVNDVSFPTFGTIPNFSSNTNNNPSNINILTDTSIKFKLNINAPTFVPKKIKNFKI